MLAPFLTFINQHQLDLKSQSSLLTVSGGVDSIVMLHLFHKMGFPAAVAHCNFGLRGEESEGDERFVEELSAIYGFPFYSKSFGIKAFAKQNGVSTQMAARTLRYEWFEALRSEHGHHWIVTAHHASDSFETVLLNLVRGTGLAGLHGISGINGHLLRPMLLAGKDDILDYANQNKLQWREDRSNATDDYKRNLVRHKVIPVLKQLNPSLEATFNQSQARLKSADIILKEALDAWSASIITIEDNQVRIFITALKAETEPVYRLWYILQNYGFAYNQIEKIFTTLSGHSGKIFQSATHTLLVDREHIIIKEAEKDYRHIDVIVHAGEQQVAIGSLSMLLEKKLHDQVTTVNQNKNEVLLNEEKLIFPLRVRKWKTGDTFQPFGMNGKSKKISDLLTDLKMDRFAKDNVLVLLNGNGDVIWVVGQRLDERYQIQEDTAHILHATVS
ncbi:tRNA lysidine(34) synthetase TilS [Dyadobacter sp. CY326]|uniref:tRNA lysidine(34) synthetase TilS n=1 Tax=Dyadobacter sp. CY326 TaxID=2907300 RepID=UPI001F469D0B|nr:tRNA lysidine(34) synthetase TilS [Dyadobacter sp. CY326]MCE7066693.1 tRNA lysidine(34) synthetase TilS [Dyadobacter sp. CY326]